jgi:hypothetical protein
LKSVTRKATMFLLILSTLISVFSISAFALEWDGSSSGGGGDGSPAGANGYAVRTTGDNCLGYRFSVVDKSGNTKSGKSIDVFRNTSYGNMEYNSAYKFTTKYNKKQLIDNQNNSYSTSNNTTNCYKEANIGFATALPTPDNMQTWQNNKTNLNEILATLGIGSIDNLKNGDKILVEPLYDVRLQSVYHSVTTTELAIYGKWILGASSNGGSSSTSASWGFISSYTNKHYPNSLFTPDGQGLWTGAGTLSSRATFYDIINMGYGVGIAYTETKPDFSPTLSVNLCEAWAGSKSTRVSHYGISYGSSFGNFVYENGYPTKGSSIWFALNFPAESQEIRVRQYVRYSDGNWVTRDVNLSNGTSSSMWYDVSLSPNTVDSGRTCFIIEAKQDWIDSNGNVLKSGAVISFYIPVKPKINRYQMTMYDITGTQVARNGSAGLSGSVYAGQRVYPKYTYTSENNWTSSNYLRGALYAWTNNAWNTVYSNNGGSDLYIDKQGINQNSPYERYSDLGLYSVPDNSANTNGSNRIPFKMWTHWASDIGNTAETTWIDIPIIKADVELKEIRLIDENNYYVTADNLWAYQKVTPQYVYKNNTNCKIYVEGYNSDGSRISGIYAISAYGEIYVNGNQITIPNQSSYSIWGGVYLDGAGIYNTQNETNGSNNTKSISYSVEHPLTIEPLTPNSLYRENTQVITSFKVKNSASMGFIPSNNISVRFCVYKGSTLLYSTTKSSVVIPANGDNLVYFKWTVPSGLNYSNIIIKGEVIDNGVIVHTKTLPHGTAKQVTSQTPDTNYAGSKPSSWSSSNTPTAYANTGTWSEWVYQNGSFVKKTYGIGLSSTSSISITPDGNSPSAEYLNSGWTMKSGYGFSLYYYPSRISVSGTTYLSNTAYTEVQGAYATLPEFNYSAVMGKYRTLELVSGVFRFTTNVATNGDRIHFIPVWYPNGTNNYAISCYAYDFWTPAGMITARVNSNSFTITGSAYDDWFIGK